MEHAACASIVIAGVLLGSAITQTPGSSIDATALMAQAARSVDLRAEGGTSFRLQASFWVQEPGGSKLEGRYVLAWRSPLAWREEITYPGHHQALGKDESGSWILTDPYRALRLFDLTNSLDVAAFARAHAGSRVESVKTPKRKIPVVQIRLALSGRLSWSELSLDRESGRLLRFETGPPASPGMRYKAIHEFSNFQPWHDLQFPGLIKRFDGTRQILELRVESIVDLPTESSALLARAEGAIPYPDCTPQEAAASVSCVSSRKGFVADRGGSGSIGARAVVARDGRLHDIVIVEPLDFTNDGRYRDYLADWRCVPLTCGGVPVDAETFEYMTLN
jgi:hypothetical protein